MKEVDKMQRGGGDDIDEVDKNGGGEDKEEMEEMNGV